eukprot:g2463.t1
MSQTEGIVADTVGSGSGNNETASNAGDDNIERTSNGGSDNNDVVEASKNIGTKRKLPKTSLLFPKTKTEKLLKTMQFTAENPKIQGEALVALSKSGEAFARVLCHVSSDLMKDNKRSRLKADDVFAALKECDFEYMIPTLKKAFDGESKGKGKSSVKVSIKNLVEHNILIPGLGVIELIFKDHHVKADLTKEGEIKYDDCIFLNPSGFALYALQKIDPAKKSANGWDQVKYQGKSLNQYKGEALSSLKIKLAIVKQNTEVLEKKAAQKNKSPRNEQSKSSENESASDASSSADEDDEEAQVLSVFD